MRVNYGQSTHGEEEIEAVVNVLRTSTQMGHNVAEFEKRVAELCSKEFGLMANSGSSSLYLAAEVMDIKPGDEFITPVLTFNTTCAPFIRKGMRPAFVDVREGTYCIDEDKIEPMITDRTRCIIVPNLIGNVPDWPRIAEIAKRHNLFVLEDSADTLGAKIGNQYSGSYADISITSFYGSHVINCAGNGGFVGFNDPEQARRARLLRSWGRSSSLFGREESETIESRFNINLDGIEYDRKFVFEELGFNLEPSELGAAFGLIQLSKLENNIERRRELFDTHVKFFNKYAEHFVLPRELENAYTGWLAFPIMVKEEAPFGRKQLQIYLEERDIQTRPVFTGNVLRQPAYANVDCLRAKEGYREADRVMKGGMLLACHQGLTDEQVDFVHETVDEFMRSHAG